MAILQLEDLTGQTEAVVFPRTYERISHLLEADTRLIVWGKVDRRDDKVQMIIEDVEPIENVRLVMVELDPLQAGNIQEQHRLQEILQKQVEEKEKARIPVFAIIQDTRNRQLVRLGRSYWVQDSRTAVEALRTANFPAHVQPLLVGNG